MFEGYHDILLGKSYLLKNTITDRKNTISFHIWHRLVRQKWNITN